MSFGNLDIKDLKWGAGQVQSVWLGPAEVWSKSVPVTITATAGAHVTEVTGSGEYVVGDTVTLTATVESEYIFDGWYDGSEKISSDNPYSFIAIEDVTLSAVGKVDERTIPLTFTAQTAGAVISLRGAGGFFVSPPWTGNYSTDGSTWQTYTLNTNITLANVGDKVYFKGTQTAAFKTSNYLQFYTNSGQVAASGSCMSLWCGDNFATATAIPYNYAGYRLFNSCKNLTTAPALPAITLTNYCYRYMFSSCTGLTTAPALPATNLATNCYQQMFYGCEALTSAPAALPATNLADCCYSSMFQDCTNLTTAPALPATNLATNCYQQMFYGCEALTSAPALPATNLASSCYDTMFYSCTNLTTMPANLLPATNLATNCYLNMFQLCSNLTTVPALPATNLANNCYCRMFEGCSNLTTVPALPATNLADNCYYRMFFGCEALTVSDTSGTGYSNAWRIPTSGTFTTTYNQQYMFTGCATGSGRASDDMAGESGKSYTYYTQNTPIS